MLTGLLCSLALAAPVPVDKPSALRLLADDPAYRKAAELESVYEGVLEESGRAYRLAGREDGKPVTWPLFLPDKPERLTPFVGKRVRVSGKLIAREGGAELWPGRLEAVPTTAAEPVRDGVARRALWQPAIARRTGASQYVLRDARQLAEVMRVGGPGAADTAAAQLARTLGVERIDWQAQMVVCVAAGLRGADADRLTVTRVVRDGSGLAVFYKLEMSGAAVGGFGYPAETVLVDRFDGPVRFVQEGVQEGAGKK